MRMYKQRARLRWRGAETVREIAKRLSRGEETLVLLPPGLHHTFCVRVGEDERSHALVDVTLDAKGFERLARIRSLHALEELREPLESAGMSVRVRTPPPQLLFVAREAVRRQAKHQHHWNATAALAV